LETNPWKIDSSWTLFLDRDGVINERIMGGYVRSLEEFIPIPDAIDSIVSLSKCFGLVFVVTNQQGVAKGLMTESTLQEIHHSLTDQVEIKGGRIAQCYYAPGMAGPENYLRKPKPGMALLAQRQHKMVDFRRSVMVGDSDSDILFGQKLGMKTVRIQTPEPIKVQADLTLNSLAAFVTFLKS
jgi:D-glycero-D-manno-heptose 1,7-bisphosphate phosphatase